MLKGEQGKKRSSADYGNFSTDLEGLFCVACHEPIVDRELVFALNFGAESKRYPMNEYLRFTGLAWHAAPGRGRDTACLDPKKLPGMAERDLENDWQRAILCTSKSRMTH